MTTHTTLRHLGRVADLAWTVFRWGVYYIFPLSVALTLILDRITSPGHQAGAYILLAALFVLAVVLVIVGSAERPAQRPRSATVRHLNRRAAVILPASAGALAAIMGVLATTI